MAPSTKTSLMLACISSLLIFSSMQIWKAWFTSSNQQTLLGGLLGAFLFTFVLTAIGNFETLFLGKGYTMGLFPEVVVALLTAVSAAACVHRIAASSCLLLSLLSLFYINNYSQKVHGAVTVKPIPAVKKKKNL